MNNIKLYFLFLTLNYFGFGSWAQILDKPMELLNLFIDKKVPLILSNLIVGILEPLTDTQKHFSRFDIVGQLLYLKKKVWTTVVKNLRFRGQFIHSCSGRVKSDSLCDGCGSTCFAQRNSHMAETVSADIKRGSRLRFNNIHPYYKCCICTWDL